VSLLNALRSHPFLKTRIALKGGTALNLFIFDVPRLSIDIDLNYVGTPDRETMLAERPNSSEPSKPCARSRGTDGEEPSSDHAGGKWRLTYAAASGRSGNVELDVNFCSGRRCGPPSLRTRTRSARSRRRKVRGLDLHELAAGKLAALLSRNASRDVSTRSSCCVARTSIARSCAWASSSTAAANRKDWRAVSAKAVKLECRRTEEPAPSDRCGREHCRGESENARVRLPRPALAVLPLTREEREFIERLNEPARSRRTCSRTMRDGRRFSSTQPLAGRRSTCASIGGCRLQSKRSEVRKDSSSTWTRLPSRAPSRPHSRVPLRVEVKLGTHRGLREGHARRAGKIAHVLEVSGRGQIGERRRRSGGRGMGRMVGNQEGLERMRFFEVVEGEERRYADANCGAGDGSEVEGGR